MSKIKPVDEEIQRLLKTVYEDCMNEDIATRERQIRTWRHLKLLWEGFARVWYSEVAHDWRIWESNTEDVTDQGAYDKPINVFKAYLESIIAALSVAIPPIKCFPDDADNTLDLATAKAGDKISQLIYRHNDVSLLWLHALFIFVTEGMTACYTYSKEDKEYGTYKEKKYAEDEQESEVTSCSICGSILDEQIIEPNAQGSNGPSGQNENVAAKIESDELSEFAPDDEDAALHAAIMSGQQFCERCMVMVDPQIARNSFVVTRLVGTTTLPKSRVCMEVYGGLYVKVANFAKHQKDTPYLIFSRENDYAMTIEKYENLSNNSKLRKQMQDRIKGEAGAYTQYDQWGRLSPQYQGEFPLNVVTVNKAWIRAGKFNILPPDDAAKLKELYPDGVHAIFVNDEFADACNESLDDHWTLSENPLSDYLNHEPLGQGLVSIQEITDDLISLVLQTIEHGIGQTFADPAVLGFKSYSETEVVPGGIFPATPKSGKSLAEGFHELRTATLSAEVLPFSQNIQSMAQLVSGALPSLFGGSIEGSETASQYSMSRAQALQRLQNTWKMLNIWWKNIFGKAIPLYILNVKEDERDVQRDNDGNFINIFIRKAELEGKIGKVELEANENLPMTWGQRKDLVEKLLTAGNPEILAILNAPENVGLIHEALGLVDFYVPGEDDIIKQYDEIKLLLNSEPIPTGDPNMPEAPSVEIDPIFDNHAVEFEICRKWVTSEAGRQTKTENEVGYRNVLLHGRMHYQMVQQAQMAQQAQGVVPGEKPNEDTQTPISGEENVATIQ